jgi:hypothetical protein
VHVYVCLHTDHQPHVDDLVEVVVVLEDDMAFLPDQNDLVLADNRAREIQCTFSPHLHHQKLLRLSQEQDFKVKIGNSSNKEKRLEINQDLLRKGVLEIHYPIWLIHLVFSFLVWAYQIQEKKKKKFVLLH